MINRMCKRSKIWICILLLVISCLTLPLPIVNAGSYDGTDLALAVLENSSYLVSSSYTDTDAVGCRQSIALSSRGTMLPTEGSSFIILSDGRADLTPATTDGFDPGDERGSWFSGGQYNLPRDTSTFSMTLQVPPFMHYIYYDIQFFSGEYPEYIGSQYNDKLTVTVNSPSMGSTEYICDVNSGDFVLDANGIPGTGFDIFATSGFPGNLDWVTTTPGAGADAGATALITREHPVSPNEQITITFEMQDSGDNMVDSSAFIDNVMFSGYARTEMIARKTVQDENGGYVECGDTLEYSITISNTGDADQGNNPGNEFEDPTPENTTYIPGSITATSGTINYDGINNKITWSGEILAESSVALTFSVIVNNSLSNGTLISNQGTVYWDSNEDGTNDAIELTDDPSIDDGIDQDNDGETNDDDPTDVYVVSFEPPESVTEDFSDDTPGGKANQSYFGHKWFETSSGKIGNIFEVVSGYKYNTLNAFKTKLRSSGSPQYWNYTLSEINRELKAWEIWFACGAASEESDLYLDFKNTGGSNIARIHFEYVQEGSNPPTDWIIKLNYYDPSGGWTQLSSDQSGGYLYNGWYKLRIEKNEPSGVNYTLYRNGAGLVDQAIGEDIVPSFANFNQIEWSNSFNPIVCPMFFWDEHTLELE